MDKKQKVYIVISQHGDYEDYRTNIEKVFYNLKDANKFREEFDKEHLVGLSEDEVYNIVPEDIFSEYPWNEDKPDYKGYTREQFEAQNDRVDEAYGLNYYGHCFIEEFEVE